MDYDFEATSPDLKPHVVLLVFHFVKMYMFVVLEAVFVVFQ